jgi:hypothetical protein
MNTGTTGGQMLHTDNRGANLVSFEVTLVEEAGAVVPTLSDEALRWCEGIADDGVGEFVLTLRHRWGKVRPVGVQLLGAGAEFAKVIAVIDGGAAANAVTIGTFAETAGVLALDYPGAARACVVTLYLSTHVDRL